MDDSDDGASLGLEVIIDGFDVASLLGLKLGTEDSSSNGLVKGFDDGSEDGFEDCQVIDMTLLCHTDIITLT
jgi:hypothetical protein